MSSPASSLPITSPATEGEEEMVEVSLPIEAAPMPPNVHPWIRWVAEPRHISIILSLFHVAVLSAGVCAVMIPDGHPYNHALTHVSADTWGVALVLGGTLGFIGALPGWWWLERCGIAMEALGFAVYVMMLWSASPDDPALLAFRTALATSLLLSCLNRYLRIAGAGLDPRRGPTSYRG